MGICREFLNIDHWRSFVESVKGLRTQNMYFMLENHENRIEYAKDYIL